MWTGDLSDIKIVPKRYLPTMCEHGLKRSVLWFDNRWITSLVRHLRVNNFLLPNRVRFVRRRNLPRLNTRYFRKKKKDWQNFKVRFTWFMLWLWSSLNDVFPLRIKSFLRAFGSSNETTKGLIIWEIWRIGPDCKNRLNRWSRADPCNHDTFLTGFSTKSITRQSSPTREYPPRIIKPQVRKTALT